MSFFLASLMIMFGAATYVSDSSVSRELIIGGVALISIILTAYTAFATYEDVKIRKKEDSEIL
jgi:disulfide bond formation protein DsbB